MPYLDSIHRISIDFEQNECARTRIQATTDEDIHDINYGYLISLLVELTVVMRMSHLNLTRRKTLIGTAAVLAGSPVVGSASAQSDALASELNAVRSATKKYKDVDVARSEGYVVESPYTPEMGFHLINPGLFAPNETAPVDITEPPILVYYTTGNYRPAPGDAHDESRDEDLRLGAVEYAHLGDSGAPGTPADYFSDGESTRNLSVSEADGWQWTPGPNITALHVWVHRGNPAGVFHPTNPTLD